MPSAKYLAHLPIGCAMWWTLRARPRGKRLSLTAMRLAEELEHEMEAQTRSRYRANKSEHAQIGEPSRSRLVQLLDEDLQSRRQIAGRPIILPEAAPDFFPGIPPSNRFEVNCTRQPRHPNTQNMAAPFQGPQSWSDARSAINALSPHLVPRG